MYLDWILTSTVWWRFYFCSILLRRAEGIRMKKAILVVSFGTTYKDTLKLTIEKIENEIKETFKDYYVKRAFTAHMIIKKIKNRDGIIVPTPEEALEELYREGYEEIIVQPLHIIPGEEFQYVRFVVDRFKASNKFKSIKLGRPALHFQGGEETPNDYEIFVDAIKDIIPADKTMVFMGHGSNHPANSAFVALQSVFRYMDHNNVYLGTVEGYPTIDMIIDMLKKDKINEVKLAPLMLVAGDHATNDMASDEEDSWKTVLEEAGINVEIYLHGLGEIKAFRDIYVNHVKDVVDNKYLHLGDTKKAK